MLESMRRRGRYETIAGRISLALVWGWLALVVPACSTVSSKSSPGHPLTGRIWDVSAARYVDRDALDGVLARADFVLLGERHDNPDHHRLQAEVLRNLIAAGRRPAVGFEMFDLDDAGAIAGHLAAAPNDAAGLGQAVNWNERGWPDWRMYQPIAEAALEAKLRIVPTNLPLATVRKMRSAGLAALDPRAVRALGLDRPLPEPLTARLADDIRAAHCGYASEESVKAMVAIQRARDAQMAQSLAASGNPQGAVLIAGAGHVRNDYGIPLYVAANAPGKRVVSIAFLEIDKQKLEPREYARAYPDGKLPFDYVRFTPRVDDEDPCEKLKAHFQRLKKPSGAR
jgi:uncharacterized iron-regulated protein